MAASLAALIPIVMTAMGDPVQDGLVASLARPAGNITGTTFLGPERVPKRLALLKEGLPKLSRIGVLWHPGAFGEATIRNLVAEVTQAAPGKPAFQPYWGKPAVRNDREDRGNVGIIEARSAPRSYPTPIRRHRVEVAPGGQLHTKLS
jgi:hypothetical protein